jgi:hypothetical protein
MKRNRLLIFGAAATLILGVAPAANVSAKSGRTFLSSVHVTISRERPLRSPDHDGTNWGWIIGAGT